MNDYFEVDICELCKHNHYYNYLDPATMEREYTSKCLKGHKRETEVLKCEDFEKDVKTIDYSILEKGFELHQNPFTGYCFVNSVECNEDGDYQFCTKEFKDTAIRLVDFLNILLRDKNQLEKENKAIKYQYNEESNEKMGLEEDVDRLLKENKELKTFKDKVFALIDARIEIYKHKPFMAPVSAPFSVNFDEDNDRLARLSELEQLKKELSG